MRGPPSEDEDVRVASPADMSAPHHLRRAYILALGALAVVAIGAQSIVQWTFGRGSGKPPWEGGGFPGQRPR